jgi:hypothetical protein
MVNTALTVPPTFPFYSGDPDDDKADKPGVWLRRFELLCKPHTTDMEKIRTFVLVLEPDSPAEEWWTKLETGRKATWDDVKTEFRMEWPPTRTLEISTEARRETLMSLKISEEEVGQMVTEGKRKDYTHAIWADKAEAVWKLLEDNKGLLIHDVRKNLPEGILDSIPDTKDTREDFKAFLQAVQDISVEKAIRHTKAAQRVCSLEDQLSLLTHPTRTPPSPMSQLSQQFVGTSIYNTPNYPRYTERTPPQQNITPNNPNTYIPPHRWETPPCPITPPRQLLTPAALNNPFTDNTTTPRQNNMLSWLQQAQSTPSPQHQCEDRAQPLAFLAQQGSRTYPDDENGHQMYERDMAAWENTYGAETPMSYNCADLPLTPGTVALGSQECYGCGLVGHTAFSPTCQLTEDARNDTRRR